MTPLVRDLLLHLLCPPPLPPSAHEQPDAASSGQRANGWDARRKNLRTPPKLKT